MSLWRSLFPDVCLGCGALLSSPRRPALCRRCGDGVAPLADPAREIDAIAACYPYEGALAAALWQLKFRGRIDLAGPLGAALADAPTWDAPWDAVVPVPLPRRRQLARGYNQSLLLARAARRHRLHRPAMRPGWLRRTGAGPAVHELPAAERAAAVRAAFVAPDPAAVAGRRILLVDDVTTTGATLSACRVALRRAGAAHVGALALMRKV